MLRAAVDEKKVNLVGFVMGGCPQMDLELPLFADIVADVTGGL